MDSERRRRSSSMGDVIVSVWGSADSSKRSRRFMEYGLDMFLIHANATLMSVIMIE